MDRDGQESGCLKQAICSALDNLSSNSMFQVLILEQVNALVTLLPSWELPDRS